MSPSLQPPPPALLRQLKLIVGEEHVRHETADRVVYSYDASVYRGLEALAVAYPENVRQVAELVRGARARASTGARSRRRPPSSSPCPA